MTDTQSGLPFPVRQSRPSVSKLLVAILGSWGFVILGCVAQQADLTRLKRDLNDQIVQIKKEKKELQDEVARAREAIAEGEKQTAALKAENQKLFRSRAEINQQFREFRENDLAAINGEIEKVNKDVEDLRSVVKRNNNQVTGRFQEVETQLKNQQDSLKAHETKTAALIQQVDQDGISYNEKIAAFQEALTAFKASLADLGNKFVQEAERDSRVETELTQQLGQKVQLSQATLDEIQTRLSTNAANIEEVSRSVSTMKDAMGQSGTLLGSRLDEEASRVAVLETKQSQLEKGILRATEKLNTDTLALKAHLDQEVQTHLGNVQSELAGLEAQVVAQSNEIQELRHTALQLKEHQDVMGSLLGQRGDDLIQKAGRLDERMKLLETHQMALDQTLETNRQNTTRHLDELTASLTSINQVIQKTTENLAAQLTTQEKSLNDLTQQIQTLQAIKGEVESKNNHITNRLAELENHQTAVTTKIDSDVQTINSHLKDVNSALSSEKQALAQVNTQLNNRINQQEQHLNKVLAGVQSVDGLNKATHDNRAHLNQLTETVNKLREVLTTIGKKFGERVDQHEERIADLAKRLNQLQAKKTN